ncbi:molecular chaperone DnaK [Thioclava sp. SK-1]|uniref:Hsp70 family protein n=1 Tax=Thioclava sp. SK-1 TaxID=1889770 RepID=UPI000824521A|nr:Hsp70 family protein [Thioclava sp. SK-1]OCX63038.1 molecular chaperone DnaK [Thioclava sp. SK-1]
MTSAPPSPILAVDFGTSNSACAMLHDGAIIRLPIEANADTLPTAVFFPDDRSEMLIGQEASEALIEGDEGRYMRALKSVLGTSLFHEVQLLGGKRRSLSQVVAEFLSVVKARAEARAGHTFEHVLSGRPVHFHTNDPERDLQAERDLRSCYRQAGFKQISFLVEPEAAALAAHGLNKSGQIGLIVDIGGGTSDFSVFRGDGMQVEILANHGIRLGGTDFDHAVSMDHAMPMLGLGGELKRTLGDGLLPVPKAIYVELSSWAKIPFAYTRETARTADDMLRHAVEPIKMQRLKRVIEDRLGHELAFAVEAGKIAANGAAHAPAHIKMGFIEPKLSVPITPGTLNASLAKLREPLRQAIYETLTQAQVTPADIGTVILVGGSSLMKMIADEAQLICPGAALERSEAFTAVVDGLALATAR